MFFVNFLKKLQFGLNKDYHEELKAEADMLVFAAINSPKKCGIVDQVISYINAYVIDNIEQKYIILRFKELYEDEEIASLLNISLEQVLEIREKTLERLRQDEILN